MAATQTAQAKSDRNGSVDDVQEQIERLRDDIAALNKSVSKLGSATVSDLKHKAAEVPHEIAGAYDGLVESLRGELDMVERQLTRNVRKSPLQAVGIAAGLGFLIALLYRR